MAVWPSKESPQRDDAIEYNHAVRHLLTLEFTLYRRDDAVGLAFPERHLTTVLDDDVARFTGRVRATMRSTERTLPTNGVVLVRVIGAPSPPSRAESFATLRVDGLLRGRGALRRGRSRAEARTTVFAERAVARAEVTLALPRRNLLSIGERPIQSSVASSSPIARLSRRAPIIHFASILSTDRRLRIAFAASGEPPRSIHIRSPRSASGEPRPRAVQPIGRSRAYLCGNVHLRRRPKKQKYDAFFHRQSLARAPTHASPRVPRAFERMSEPRDRRSRPHRIIARVVRARVFTTTIRLLKKYETRARFHSPSAHVHARARTVKAIFDDEL